MLIGRPFTSFCFCNHPPPSPILSPVVLARYVFSGDKDPHKSRTQTPARRPRGSAAVGRGTGK